MQNCITRGQKSKLTDNYYLLWLSIGQNNENSGSGALSGKMLL